MIYCIWYPSGGFGHFVNGILTLYGEGFKRPNNSIEFSTTGDSHNLELVAPKYFLDPPEYNFKFDDRYKYSVLIDNGINNEGTKFKSQFSTAHVIKICYDDQTWPIVARTMIDKAMRSSINDQLPITDDGWKSREPWAEREKYFLFLRDHALKNSWKPMPDTINLMIDDLLDYNRFVNALAAMDIHTNDFQSIWEEWYRANFVYISPIIQSRSVIEHIKNNKSRTITDFDTVWAQAVLYYFIWLEFGKEVPHNNFAEFFPNIKSIQRWLES